MRCTSILTLAVFAAAAVLPTIAAPTNFYVRDFEEGNMRVVRSDGASPEHKPEIAPAPPPRKKYRPKIQSISQIMRGPVKPKPSMPPARYKTRKPDGRNLGPVTAGAHMGPLKASGFLR
ncbi:hypothetical protein C8Q72DRAFT_124728 [Fomitopsis betulina]|nr:hypothetical protein C8Q72DRAFT_124728 [Fomitopsis betulina]